MISIVTPVYNEEENIPFFYEEVTKVMQSLGTDYEIIYVNDGSRDKSEFLLNELAQKDSHVRALTFAKNFGHQIAITCGMDFAKGNCVITMDGDLQHPPELIPVLVEKWREGYDVVQTVRTATSDANWVKKLTSKSYYAFINTISTTPVVPGGSDFRLMSRKALNTFLKFKEHNRFIRGIVGGMGFKQTTVSFKAPKRHAGVSKFSMRKMLHLAVDGILANSTLPLRASFYIGLLSGFLGCVMIIHVLFCYLTDSTVPGWSTVTILISLFGSVNLMGLGIIGEYISRIYEETRNRPLYWLSDDTANHNKEN